MDFYEVFDTVLQKASTDGFFTEFFHFSDTVMFVIHRQADMREVFVKYMSPEMIADARMLALMKQYLDSNEIPFVVKFMNVTFEDPLPAGFVKQDDDILYGFLEFKFRHEMQTEKECLFRSDYPMSFFSENCEALPVGSKLVGYPDDEIIFSTIWEKDRTFVFGHNVAK